MKEHMDRQRKKHTSEWDAFRQQVKELLGKRLPLLFPNRLFPQAPAGIIHGWQDFTGKGPASRPPSAATASPAAAAATTTSSGQKAGQASTADKPGMVR